MRVALIFVFFSTLVCCGIAFEAFDHVFALIPESSVVVDLLPLNDEDYAKIPEHQLEVWNDLDLVRKPLQPSDGRNLYILVWKTEFVAKNVSNHPQIVKLSRSYARVNFVVIHDGPDPENYDPFLQLLSKVIYIRNIGVVGQKRSAIHLFCPWDPKPRATIQMGPNYDPKLLLPITDDQCLKDRLAMVPLDCHFFGYPPSVIKLPGGGFSGQLPMYFNLLAEALGFETRFKLARFYNFVALDVSIQKKILRDIFVT